MNRKYLLALWGGLFVVCGALGFVPEPSGALSFLMALLSLVFFAPPVLLLRQAGIKGHVPTAVLVRNISALSLGLTLAVLIANVLSLLGSAALGDVLHVVLEKGQDKNEISSEVSSESSSSEEESGQSGEEGESSEKTSA